MTRHISIKLDVIEKIIGENYCTGICHIIPLKKRYLTAKYWLNLGKMSISNLYVPRFIAIWNQKGWCNKVTKLHFESGKEFWPSWKKYESIEVDHKTWLHVPSGIFGPPAVTITMLLINQNRLLKIHEHLFVTCQLIIICQTFIKEWMLYHCYMQTTVKYFSVVVSYTIQYVSAVSKIKCNTLYFFYRSF